MDPPRAFANPSVVKPDVDEVPEVTQGLVRLLGAGIPTSGLTPPLVISVEPNGMVPPLSVDPTVPGVDSGDAIPVGVTVDDDVAGDDVVAHVPEVAVRLDMGVVPAAVVPDVGATDVMPPPSNVELPVVVLVVVVPEPGNVPVLMQPEPLLVAPGTTPRPPGSISVAPSGMPVVLGLVAPGMPSGDVAPNADGLVAEPIEVCAWLTAQLSKTMAMIATMRRIWISYAVSRVRFEARPTADVGQIGTHEWRAIKFAFTEKQPCQLQTVRRRHCKCPLTRTR